MTRPDSRRLSIKTLHRRVTRTSAVQENLRQRTRHPVQGDHDEQTEREPDGSVASDTGLTAFAAGAIARLASPYREALTLTELEGMTQVAAAKVLGISPSGMKSRVQRGRQKLREILESSSKIALDVRGGVIECEPRQPGNGSCNGRD